MAGAAAGRAAPRGSQGPGGAPRAQRVLKALAHQPLRQRARALVRRAGPRAARRPAGGRQARARRQAQVPRRERARCAAGRERAVHVARVRGVAMQVAALRVALG